MSRPEDPFFPSNCTSETAERLIDYAHESRLQRESDLESEGRELDRDRPDFVVHDED